MKRPIERAARHTVVASIATALLLVFAGVGLSQALVSGPQEAGSSLSTDTGTTGNGGQGNGDKVQICHFTHSKKHPAHTIWVSKNAEPAFVNANRKDHEGPCTADEMKPITTTASQTTTTTKGKGKHKPKSKSKPHHGGGKKK